MVCTVEEAIKLGADAVSVHVNLGAEDEGAMLKDLGSVAKEAMDWGMPLLAMMYVRGPKVKNQYDVSVVKHAARVGAELGADIVKVPLYGVCRKAFEKWWRDASFPWSSQEGRRWIPMRIFWKW